jgi:hypothetical protein
MDKNLSGYNAPTLECIFSFFSFPRSSVTAIELRKFNTPLNPLLRCDLHGLIPLLRGARGVLFFFRFLKLMALTLERGNEKNQLLIIFVSYNG